MDEEIIELEEDVEKVEVPQKGEERSKQRPAFRIVQPDTDRDGKTIFRSVGAVWKQTSKNGKEFYVIKIGDLRLLMFPNE